MYYVRWSWTYWRNLQHQTQLQQYLNSHKLNVSVAGRSQRYCSGFWPVVKMKMKMTVPVCVLDRSFQFNLTLLQWVMWTQRKLDYSPSESGRPVPCRTTQVKPCCCSWSPQWIISSFPLHLYRRVLFTTSINLLCGLPLFLLYLSSAHDLWPLSWAGLSNIHSSSESE